MSEWGNFRKAVEELFPNFIGALNDGAKESEILDFEESIQLRLPESVRDIYLNSNGQNDSVNAYFFGMRLLSLSEIRQAMDRELEVMEELAEEWDMCSSFPEKHIKLAYVNPKWVPVFYSGSGYIGVDLDPDVGGSLGQVINFGIDDEDKFVFASDMSEFLIDSTQKITDRKNVNYNQEYKMYFYTDLGFPSALAKELTINKER